MLGFAPCMLDEHLCLQVQSLVAVSVHVAGGQEEASFPFTYRMRAQSLSAVTLGGELRKGEVWCALLHPQCQVLHLEMEIQSVAGSLFSGVSHGSATCEGHCLSLQKPTAGLGITSQAEERR